jgi:DNA protecting protein DprA
VRGSLLAAFGSPQAVAAACPPAPCRPWPAPRLAAEIQREPADLAHRLADVQAWLAAGPQRHVITLGDAAYPQRALLESPDPPLLLYVTGDVRRCRPLPGRGGQPPAQPAGRDNARDFARQFAEAGYVVVSGLALGVDGAAHEGALAGGGRTVAVVGTGPDRVYPKRHLDLARRIADQGAWSASSCPARRRCRSTSRSATASSPACRQGTLVVEAALQSGSLITARLANEAGREVFAIPGSIHAEQSRGCHALIRDGAGWWKARPRCWTNCASLRCPAGRPPDRWPRRRPSPDRRPTRCWTRWATTRCRSTACRPAPGAAPPTCWPAAGAGARRPGRAAAGRPVPAPRAGLKPPSRRPVSRRIAGV